MIRLSSTAREKLYNAEAEKAREAGLGDLPICNICGFPIDGTRQRWDQSHQKEKPRWLGGEIESLAHSRCNRKHNNSHDTPLFAKNNRIRQRHIGATRSQTPLPGGVDDRLKKTMRGRVVDRATGREL